MKRYAMYTMKIGVDACEFCGTTNDKNEAIRWKRIYKHSRTKLYIVWDSHNSIIMKTPHLTLDVKQLTAWYKMLNASCYAR